MKIVIATFTYPPEVDGVAMAAGIMARSFAAAGHEVHIATGAAHSSHKIDSTGISVHHFTPSREPKAKISGDYQQFLIGANADVSIFHCWNSWPTDLALQVLGKIPGKKVILSHGYDTHKIHWQKKFPWGLFAWFKLLPKTLRLPRDLKAFDRVVFLSHKKDGGRFFDSMVASWTIRKKTRVIPNTIHLSSRACDLNFREKHQLGTGIFFLCVANYSRRKNQLLALESFLNANVPGSSMVFIGSALGDYGSLVRERWIAREAQHPELKVLFLENVPREEVTSAFIHCDAFVLSATAETQPIVLLEAMSHGKPFISTDTGCVSEFDGGIISPDAESMTRGMQRLATDEEARRRLGREGHQYYLDHHTAEVVKRLWLELIDELR